MVFFFLRKFKVYIYCFPVGVAKKYNTCLPKPISLLLCRFTETISAEEILVKQVGFSAFPNKVPAGLRREVTNYISNP